MARSADKQAAIRAAIKRRLELVRAHHDVYSDMIAKTIAAIERSYRLLDETAPAVRNVKLDDSSTEKRS